MSKFMKEIEKMNSKNIFMIEEIKETPIALARTVEKEFQPIDDVTDKLIQKDIDALYFVGSGSSYYLNLAANCFARKMLRVPTNAFCSSEFIYYLSENLSSDSLVCFSSVSGETTDLLKAVKRVKKLGLRTVSFTNTADSTLHKIVNYPIVSHAGPVKSIGHTKVFPSLLAAEILFILQLSRKLLQAEESKIDRYLEELRSVHTASESVVKNTENSIKSYASSLVNKNSAIIVGRGPNYATALHGAILLKEGSLLHTEAIQAGEFRHGTNCLVEKDFPVVVLIQQGKTSSLLIRLAEDLKELEASLLILADQSFEDLASLTENVIFLPPVDEYLSPLIYSTPLEFLAYYRAVLKGFNPDEPRRHPRVVRTE